MSGVLKRRRLLMVVISAVAAIVVLRGVYRAYLGPPVISIINASPYEVTELVLRGEVFVKAVDRIPIGATQTIVVHPAGESGLRMEFLANGQRLAKESLAYIEGSGGYCVSLIIDDQLEIRPVDVGFCFAIRRAV